MTIENTRRFAEWEKLTGDYFTCHLAPVMSRVRHEISENTANEMRAHTTDTAGILSSMSSAGLPDSDSFAPLKVTGKWSSKQTEDYLSMCKEQILGDKNIQKDLLVMAEEWRTAVVKEIGRARYDTLSSQLGCDLAYAYTEHRVEELMIDKMVKDGMPRSSLDYVVRRMGKSSLFGLTNELEKSPLAAEIERRGEAAFKPTKTQKGAGMVLGSAIDAVCLGGGNWVSLAKFIGIDLALNAGVEYLGREGTTDENSVESCISKGVFSSDDNVFVTFRAEADHINNYESDFIIQTNSRLNNKIPTMDISFMNWDNTPASATSDTLFPWSTATSSDKKNDNAKNDDAQQRKNKYEDVPLIVAPGHEDEYLNDNAQWEEQSRAEQEEETEIQEESSQEQDVAPVSSAEAGDGDDVAAAQDNAGGWDSLLQTFGLNGISDIGKNLGYILATLPDILVGLFTGKTKSLNLSNNLLPIAAVVTGMFVKNPILKILLMGMGGANLLNKAGHEVLDRKRQDGAVTRSADGGAVRYRQYADEPLNARITSPVLQGHCLIANIDGVPCTIQLSDNIVGAWQSGALPLNTLANAVLAKNDEMRQTASRHYEEEAQNAEETRSEDTRETITRTRGIQ